MPHILIIDNDRSVGAAMQLMLESGDHTSLFAGDARAAFGALDTADFDLVLVDMLMPDMDGLETMRRIRERKPKTRILAMSGFRRRGPTVHAGDPLEAAMRAGAIASLRKPFSQEELLAAVDAATAPEAASAGRIREWIGGSTT